MKIYLDNCCYNRPFDDQTQLRVSLETQSKLFIQALVVKEKVELVWSYILSLENTKNPYENKRLSISRFAEYAKIKVIESEALLKKANKIASSGIKNADALHIACAIEAFADYFITTDNRILRYNGENIKIVNPVEFVLAWEMEK
ncbi:MAG: PIN domain-containing protein [Fibromonadaceae bacterium]|nr:PIN domain-containing protein [Fibromonadaceae bacterium]